VALNGRPLRLPLPTVWIPVVWLPLDRSLPAESPSGTAESAHPVFSMSVWDGAAARGGVGALGGVTARGSVGALGGVAARGSVGALGGAGMRGAPCALCRRARGTSSSSSSSSIKSATTLGRFWLLYSSSIIRGPPCLGGPWTSFSEKAPLLRDVFQLLSPSPKAPARLRRLASRRRARQKRILLLGSGHGSCRQQIGSYGCEVLNFLTSE
jgi:hypothetical protein